MYNYNEIYEAVMRQDVSMNPPDTEPDRQYWYIKQLKSLIDERRELENRDFTACVVTFGCQMNARDSEKILGILKIAGFKPTEDENADLVIYNTCTVRENANLKVYGRLGRLKRFKENNPNMIIALCGCMMQEEQVVDKIKKSYRNVDIIFGTYNIYAFSELLAGKLLDIVNSIKEGENYQNTTVDTSYIEKGHENQVQKTDKKHKKKHKLQIEILDKYENIVEELPKERKYSFKSGVNIMFGCDNFCTYCIVPYVRGREISRKPEDIIAEVESLAKDGVKEIMLLGQNVNSYGKKLENPISFAELIRMVDKIDGIERIRFMTSHPKDLSDDLIDAMAECKKVCNYLHLPVQSGSTKLLKKMNRCYTKEDYLNLVHKIKAKIPDIALSTDIIVGFPGETEEDFNETLEVVKECEYNSVFTFQYSKRSGTPAAVMEDQIDEETVTRHFQSLLELVNDISVKKTAEDLGKVQDVLVEDIDSHDETFVTGRTEKNYLVHFKGDASLIGEIVSVKLVENKGFYYIGERV